MLLARPGLDLTAAGAAHHHSKGAVALGDATGTGELTFDVTNGRV
ncbi:MAG: hypothetical protein ABIX28_06890 [Vicinamibacterales bacterium]